MCVCVCVFVFQIKSGTDRRNGIGDESVRKTIQNRDHYPGQSRVRTTGYPIYPCTYPGVGGSDFLFLEANYYRRRSCRSRYGESRTRVLQHRHNYIYIYIRIIIHNIIYRVVTLGVARAKRLRARVPIFCYAANYRWTE